MTALQHATWKIWDSASLHAMKRNMGQHDYHHAMILMTEASDAQRPKLGRAHNSETDHCTQRTVLSSSAAATRGHLVPALTTHSSINSMTLAVCISADASSCSAVRSSSVLR